MGTGLVRVGKERVKQKFTSTPVPITPTQTPPLSNPPGERHSFTGLSRTGRLTKRPLNGLLVCQSQPQC